ncbi:MAG: hypothetical protein ACRCVI_01070 [Mycoplasmoidaceae bacterium]
MLLSCFSLHNNDTVAKLMLSISQTQLSFSLHNNDTVAKYLL